MFEPKVIAERDDENGPFKVVEAFGETFMVREGKENTRAEYFNVCQCEDEDSVPDLLITSHISDTLYWTDWETCLAEWATIPWEMNPNLNTEAFMLLSRTIQEELDLVDIIALIIKRKDLHRGTNQLTLRLIEKLKEPLCQTK